MATQTTLTGKNSDIVKHIPLPGARNVKLWKHFGVPSKDGKTAFWGDGKKKVLCKIDGCKDPEISYSGNTTNLERHLADHHVAEHAAYSGLSPASPVSHSSITSFMSPGRKMSLNDKKAKAITEGILACMVEDLRPISMVESSGFRKLMDAAAPDYPLASARVFGDKIRAKYSVTAMALKARLADIRYVAITTDLWTSAARHAYLGITAHFMTADWNLETRLLDCVEQAGDEHSAEDIASAMMDRLQFWGLMGDDGHNKVSAGVSDNGANMVNAIKDHLKLPLHVGCFSHTVNLCVEKGMLFGFVLFLNVAIQSYCNKLHKKPYGFIDEVATKKSNAKST
jgi:hypothetical protein